MAWWPTSRASSLASRYDMTWMALFHPSSTLNLWCFLIEQSISAYLGEDKVKEIVNFVLVYIAGIDIPIKR